MYKRAGKLGHLWKPLDLVGKSAPRPKRGKSRKKKRRMDQARSAAPIALVKPATADVLLSWARAKASTEQKSIFIYFGASWWRWCRRLWAFLHRPDIRFVFEKAFVPVMLTVLQKRANLGADALLNQFGGPAGLPYYAFLDAKGALIVNSKLKGQNIGYPGQPEEIDWFIQMMKKAAPKMSADDLKTIETALRSFKRT
jgi:hypothetical protein